MIYTDGITEAMRRGTHGLELFGTEGLDQLLSEYGSGRPSDCAAACEKGDSGVHKRRGSNG